MLTPCCSSFIQAVSQWGSDFEMISRLFPDRDRKQVKQKWHVEERARPALLDAAFARRLPVSLKKYGAATGVDLSGPPPKIEARAGALQAKLEAAAAAAAAGGKKEERSETVERGEDGQEIVYEGDEEEAAATPAPTCAAARQKSSTPGKGYSSHGEESEGDLPSVTEIISRGHAAAARHNRPRASSNASSASALPAAAAGRAPSVARASTSASAATSGMSREKRRELERRKEREERERSRRRRVPDAAEEEIIGEV
jgi:hypothetical protein